MFALRFEEATALVDRSFHNRVFIVGEWDVGSVRFEEVLVDVESGSERFERCFKTLDGIFLLDAVEAFIIDALNLQDDSQVSRLGKKRGVVPKPVKVDVVIESGAFFPWLDDSV